MDFSQRVWDLARKIPKGRVTTYKIMAEELGTRAYRAVGNALNRNPHAPAVPCHRVVRSDGHVGGFAHGTKKKIEMLRKEGVKVSAGRVDSGFIFRF